MTKQDLVYQKTGAADPRVHVNISVGEIWQLMQTYADLTSLMQLPGRMGYCENCHNQDFNETMGCLNYLQDFKCQNFRLFGSTQHREQPEQPTIFRCTECGEGYTSISKAVNCCNKESVLVGTVQPEVSLAQSMKCDYCDKENDTIYVCDWGRMCADHCMVNPFEPTQAKGVSRADAKLVICPICGGDGKETCTNPDHGFINMVGGETQRLGCPGCGHDPEHKVKNGGKCDECKGTGRVTNNKYAQLCDAYGIDDPPQPVNEGWIKVEDRLPEIGQLVLCIQNPETTATKEPLYAIFDGIGFMTDKITIFANYEVGKSRWSDIISWRPLPSPPKPEKP